MMDIKKEATKVNKKLADVVEKLENLEMQIKMILYGGIAILSLNVLMLFIYLIWGSWLFRLCPGEFLLKKTKFRLFSFWVEN